MNLQTFALPDVGEGLTEAEILDWRVSPGDEVGVNQILVEIETAKAAVELPSPYAGRVTSILVSTGQTVDVGVPIITIDTDPNGTEPAPPATPDLAGSDADEAGTKIGEMTADGKIATLVGYVSAVSTAGRRPRKAVNGATVPTAPAPAPVTVAAAAPPASAPPASAPAALGDAARAVTVAPSPATVPSALPLAAPPVRMLAKELGVDLHTVIPTGRGGVVTRDDVQHAAAPAVPAGATSDRQRRVPIKGIRKVTAAAMVASAFTAPHATVFVAVDVTEMMALRARLRTRPEFAGTKLTPLAFAARAACIALKRSPDLNAFWDEAAQEIVFQDQVNLGIAAATPRGLVVPNIVDADALDLRGLADALTELTDTARAGKTSPAAMSGGTFTITNIGVFGVDAGTPIINPGESAILAVGAIRDTPWVVDSELAVRKVCQLSLSFDHRLIDGAQGSKFLSEVAALLAEPGLALAW